MRILLSCLREWEEDSIRYGPDFSVLSDNMWLFRIEPGSIDALVFSHNHGDHDGGVPGILKSNPRIDVYAPASYGSALGSQVLKA